MSAPTFTQTDLMQLLTEKTGLPAASHTSMASPACSRIERASRSEATISSCFFCAERSVTTTQRPCTFPRSAALHET